LLWLLLLRRRRLLLFEAVALCLFIVRQYHASNAPLDSINYYRVCSQKARPFRIKNVFFIFVILSRVMAVYKLKPLETGCNQCSDTSPEHHQNCYCCDCLKLIKAVEMLLWCCCCCQSCWVEWYRYCKFGAE